MAIFEHLALSNFRLFKQFSIQPHNKINVLCGVNASGKTSVLEAIYYLSSGKSFCTKNLDELYHLENFSLLDSTGNTPSLSTEEYINNKLQGVKKLHLKGSIRREDDSPNLPAMEYETIREESKNIYKISAKIQKNVVKHAEAIATLLITPESLLMVGGMPNLRRKRLNWGCFYLFPLYHKIYRDYDRALKQRNKALKQHFKKADIQIWNEVLAREARYISECRELYINLLEPFFKSALKNTLHSLDVEQITLSYQNTISQDSALNLSEQLWLNMYEQSFNQDVRDRHTNYGPHRGDMLIKFANAPIERQLSRGQWKILSSTLLLAQARLLQQELNIHPIILIDDFSSELDSTHRNKLIRYIEEEIGAQTFISTVSKDILKDYHKPSSLKFFPLTNPNIVA